MRKIFQFLLRQKKNGFTIIELLVTVGILAVVGVISTGIFFIVLRNNARSTIEGRIKQKGEFVLGVIERMVRGATEIENAASFCDDSYHDSFSIISLDSQTTEFICTETEISSNSAVLLGALEEVEIDCDRFVSCSLGENGTPMITINFSLNEGGALALPFQRAAINFQTSVVPRNYF